MKYNVFLQRSYLSHKYFQSLCSCPSFGGRIQTESYTCATLVCLFGGFNERVSHLSNDLASACSDSGFPAQIQKSKIPNPKILAHPLHALLRFENSFTTAPQLFLCSGCARIFGLRIVIFEDRFMVVLLSETMKNLIFLSRPLHKGKQEFRF